MFKSKTFYHQHVRKTLKAFGIIFSQIKVNRTNGTTTQLLDVPVTYGPKQKFITRILEAPSVEDGRATFATTLPRIGYEISNLTYDADRKLTTTGTVKSITASNDVDFAFTPVPYVMTVKATIFVKHQDDGYQILEQLLPYFTPDFNITVNELPALGVKRDLQITLESIEHNDTYEGTLEERRVITWDLTFTVKMHFFGYVNRSTLIKKAIIDFFATSDTQAEVGTRVTSEIDPTDQSPDSNFTFTTDIIDLPTEL